MVDLCLHHYLIVGVWVISLTVAIFLSLNSSSVLGCSCECIVCIFFSLQTNSHFLSLCLFFGIWIWICDYSMVLTSNNCSSDVKTVLIFINSDQPLWPNSTILPMHTTQLLWNNKQHRRKQRQIQTNSQKHQQKQKSNLNATNRFESNWYAYDNWLKCVCLLRDSTIFRIIKKCSIIITCVKFV